MGIGRLLGAAPGAQYEQDGRSSPAFTLDTAALNVRVRAGLKSLWNQLGPFAC